MTSRRWRSPASIRYRARRRSTRSAPASAAALAALAAAGQRAPPGLRVFGEAEGLLLLPDLEFALFEKPRPGVTTAALSAVLASLNRSAERAAAHA
jgi:hypothetical protein